MRSPERLDNFYAYLDQIHKTYCPDWRFMQLICNLQSYIGSDMFYFEEDRFINKLDEFCKHTFKLEK